MSGFPDLHYLLDLLELMSTESVMPSNHLIFCRLLLLLLSIFSQHQGLLHLYRRDNPHLPSLCDK